MNSDMLPIISIVGRSNSGKTTLIEKLIPELKRRGYSIGTIKHTHHAPDIDRPGKDSSRHSAAGADTVMLASPGRVAMIKQIDSEGIDALAGYFNDVDLLMTEGYKREPKPKIEVVRAAMGTELLCRNDPHLVAVATDAQIAVDVPVFRLDDPGAIADFIEQKFLNRRQ